MRSRWKAAFCVKCNKEQPLIHNPAKGPKFICAVCKDPVRLPNARGAKPTRSKHTGAMFPSIEESKREPDLLALERGGAISDLRMQAWRDRPTTIYRLDVFGDEPVRALVGEALRAAAILREAQGAMVTGTVLVSGNVIGWRDFQADLISQALALERRVQELNRAKHHVTTYTPDMEYREPAGGELVVEDVKTGSGRKGAGEATFVMKKRLMLACHGIQVRAVYGSGKRIYGKRQGG